jgi:leucyl aminopeptidase
MGIMKKDMGGAANVLALARAIMGIGINSSASSFNSGL